jgi:tetratricopeptide (TPR) repeat protein
MAMSKEEISQKIGDGWALQSKGDSQGAAQAFQTILSEDVDQVDAYYGLGLSLRAAGDKAAAKAAFEKALVISERELAGLRSNRGKNDLGTSRDDRYMMLIRMLEQRISEV